MSAYWKHFPKIQGDLNKVWDLLKSESQKAPQPLRPELEALAANPGKGLRAALLLATARVGSPKLNEAHYALAAGIELLHLASLIHDDVVDSSQTRRGSPSLSSRLGPRAAVLYGDLLFASCFRLITSHCSEENARNLARVVELMAGTEILQLQERGKFNPSLLVAKKKIMGKTAALFSMCFFVGASEGGLSLQEAKLLRRAGYAFGMAFQIEDDLLDLTQEIGAIGKPVGHDLKEGHFSLPVVLAAKSRPQVQKLLIPALGASKLDDRDKEELLKALKQSNSLDDSKVLAEEYRAWTQKDLLRALGETRSNELLQILEHVSQRKF